MVVGEFTEDVDVAIIGGGPAGYHAAFDLARGGRAPIVIDPRGRLGGTCLFAGCIGSKTLIEHVCHQGASVESAIAESTKAIETLAKGLEREAQSLGVRVLRGKARFADRRTLQVAGDTVGRLRFKRAIICTGGWPAGTDDTYTAASVTEQPNLLEGCMQIRGDGPQAVELAAIAAAAGVQTFLEAPGDLLSGLPRELVKPVARLLDRAGVSRAQAPEHARVIHAGHGPADHSPLDLEQTSVTLDANGWIKVDEKMQTQDGRILAAGGCTGLSPWAGASLRMGAVAASTLLEGSDAFDGHAEPRTVWAPPGLSWCGPDALEGYKTITVPWGHSGQAVLRGAAASGRTMLAWEEASGIVVGAGAVGQGATEHAESFSLTVELAATLEDLALRTPAHPTCSELLGEAARQALQDTA
ncbi:MAG: FAD-dependent oxidoreductase [Phycisphaerales bacterium]|nr:FAD-dependent oxidoreductase [Phycisphaerales bacterium]